MFTSSHSPHWTMPTKTNSCQIYELYFITCLTKYVHVHCMWYNASHSIPDTIGIFRAKISHLIFFWEGADKFSWMPNGTSYWPLFWVLLSYWINLKSNIFPAVLWHIYSHYKRNLTEIAEILLLKTYFIHTWI